MSRRILITGGAGFIGSHLADRLLECGHAVRVLDNLTPQVHGAATGRPAHLHPDVELVQGDARDPRAVRRALQDVDAVYHFAASVGVGQSMYEMRHYVETNAVGTTVLLEQLVERPVERLVVASSMSIYGEGLYLDSRGRRIEDAARDPAQLRAGEWDPLAEDGTSLVAVPTPEEKRPSLASVYALTKYDQERLCLLAGAAYGIPTVALRFFNVYGPRQALGNPYTGVLAIFASRILNGRPPLVFEDGRQRRDFVSVHDVARACVLALDAPDAPGNAINVASGSPQSVLEVAEALLRVLGRRDLAPEVTGRHRVGDVRHCFADVARARGMLGYRPGVAFEDGLRELGAWLGDQRAEDRTEEARSELAKRGLVV